MTHKGQKTLAHDFDTVWEHFKIAGRVSLVTVDGHDFDAFAAVTKKGSRQGERVIRIMRNDEEFAHVYPCC